MKDKVLMVDSENKDPECEDKRPLTPPSTPPKTGKPKDKKLKIAIKV